MSDAVWIPGGTFLMGSDRHYPEEAPAHRVRVNGFWMDRYAVTNAEFRRFVDATGHVTLAERPANAADYPGAKPEMLVPSSVMFKKARTVSTSAITTTGGSTCRVRTGATRRVPRARCRVCGSIRSCTSRSRMPKPTRSGRASNCRPRPSGNLLRVAAWTAPSTRGARSSRRAAGRWPIPGRGNFPGRTCCRTATSGRRR